jgi:hypothetical protein
MEYPRTPELTGDSFVNFEDFAKMTQQWQSCDNPDKDVTGDGCVNFEDLFLLADYWLKNV